MLSLRRMDRGLTMTPNPDLHTMMNKYALAFVSLACTLGASAQNWITLTDEAGDDVTNGSVSFWQWSGAMQEIDVFTELIGGNDRVVNVKRYEMGVVPGSQNYFCWGLCYLQQDAGALPLWVSTNTVDMTPGTEYNNFHGYHVPNGTEGYSTYRFVFYDTANPNDSAFVDLEFGNSLGVAETVLAQSFVINPNPANDAAVVTFSSGPDAVVVHNALGAQVLDTRIAPGQLSARLNTSMLQEGLYFVSLQRQGRTVGTQRLVLTR